MFHKKDVTEKKENNDLSIPAHLRLDLKEIQNKKQKEGSLPGSPTSPREGQGRLISSAPSIFDDKFIKKFNASQQALRRIEQLFSEEVPISPRVGFSFGKKTSSPRMNVSLNTVYACFKKILLSLKMNPSKNVGKYFQYYSNFSTKPLEFLATQSGSDDECKIYYLDKLKLLGEGAQGKVYVGYNLVKEEQVAIKCFEFNSQLRPPDIETEIANLKTIGEFKGYCQSDDAHFGYILMEYHQGQNLTAYLYEVDDNIDKERPEHFISKKSYNPLRQIQLIRLIITAIIELHELGLIHRDLKPDNFIIDSNKNVVHLIDVGSAINSDNLLETDYAGSFGYAPYETTLGKERIYSFQSDYFSLGIILAEILTGFNYQQQLRKSLSNLETGKFMRELTLEELKKFFPDVFNPEYIDPSFKVGEEIDQWLYRSLFKTEISALVNHLIELDPINRPTRECLKLDVAKLQRLEQEWILLRDNLQKIQESMTHILGTNNLDYQKLLKYFMMHLWENSIGVKEPGPRFFSKNRVAPLVDEIESPNTPLNTAYFLSH